MKTVIRLTAREFRTLFEPVLPWAGTDDMLPVLTGVHVRVKDGYVVAAATDRFRLAVNRVKPLVAVHGTRSPRNLIGVAESSKERPLNMSSPETWPLEAGWSRTSPDPDFDALIPRGQLQTALGLFKAPLRIPAGLEPVVTMSLDTDGDWPKLTLTADLVKGDLDNLTMSFRTLDGTFPSVGRMMAEACSDTEVHRGNVGLNPRLLSGWAVACRVYGEEAIQWKPRGPAKAMLGFVGEHFVGLVMPRRRLTSDLDDSGQWDGREEREWATFLA